MIILNSISGGKDDDEKAGESFSLVDERKINQNDWRKRQKGEVLIKEENYDFPSIEC